MVACGVPAAGFCQRNRRTSPDAVFLLIQCSLPAIARESFHVENVHAEDNIFHDLCKNPPAYRRRNSMPTDIGTLDTFPKLLRHHARVRPGLPAIREKD